MRTDVVRIDPNAPDPEVIARAARVILEGGLVAFPTETVYGLGALGDDAAAIARIYAAKERPAHNPLIAHVAGIDDARRIAGAWPDSAERLATAFWPGPLTVVVPRGRTIPPELSAGSDTMAIRAPAHPVATALLRAVGRPIAAPSANPANQLSPTRAEHVIKFLAGRIEMVLDAGPCALGIESTVVDLTSETPRVLRLGSLDLESLARVVPGLARVPGTVAAAGKRASPGLDEKHYAPRAKLYVVSRDRLLSLASGLEQPLGILTRGEPLPAGVARQLTLPEDPVAYGAGLFDSLHALDDAGCRAIVLESVPDEPRWAAVRDRLTRASAG